MKTSPERYNKLFISMRYWLLGREYYRSLEALEFASTFHTGVRKDGITKEYAHQLAAGHYLKTIVTKLELPEETLAAVFLHDLSEDYNVPIEEIETRFGSAIAEPVWLLTKVFRGERKSDEAYYRDIASSKVASVVKGADRIHNVQTMVGVFTLEKQQAYIRETKDFVLPALKEARRRFPKQEPVYENMKHVLTSQLELIEAVHRAELSVR